MANSAEYGPVATRVLFENDDVRIWEMDLKPGEVCGLHHHTLDYVLYILSGAKVGIESPQHRSYTLEAPTRAAYFIPAGGVEAAHNVGETRFHEALFELKRPAKPHQQNLGFVGCEALVGQLPKDGTIHILENDRVRISETTLPPGGGYLAGHRSRDSVAFVIQGSRLKLFASEGQKASEPESEESRAPNSVSWQPGGVTNRIVNIGTGTYRQVLVELK